MRLYFLIVVLVLAGLSCLITGCGEKSPIQTAAGKPVTVDIPVVSPAKALPDQPVTITVDIHNPENAPVDYEVVLTVNDQTAETKRISITGKETRPVEFQFTPTTTGTQRVSINGQTAVFNVIQPAGFSVESLSLSPDAPVAGKEFTVSAVVQNNGDVSGSFSGILKINGTEAGKLEATIEPGAQKTISVTSSLAEAGTYSIELAGLKKEMKVFTPAVFQADSITSSPPFILPGETAVIEAVITNTGEIKDTQPVALLMNDKEADSQMLTLGPGASQKVSFSLKPGYSGLLNLKIKEAKGTLMVTMFATYHNKSFFYNISYPFGFNLIDTVPETVCMEKPDVGGLTVLVDRLSTTSTLDDYFDGIVTGKKAYLPDWQYSSRSEISENGNVVGYRYDYTNSVDGKPWIGKGMIIKKGGLGLYVVFTTYEKDWELYKKMADPCLESFKMPVVHAGTYSSEKLNIKLALPAEWSFIETSNTKINEPVLSFIPPFNQPMIKGGLYIKPVSTGATAQQQLAEEAQSGVQLGILKVQEQGQFTFANGTKGYAHIESSAIDWIDMKSISIAYVKDNKMYQFEFFGPTSDFDALNQSIKQLARVLEVK